MNTFTETENGSVEPFEEFTVIPLTHLWIGQELPGQFWESFESLPMLRQWPELVHRPPSAWELWSQGRVATNHRIIWMSLGWASYPKQGKFWRYGQSEPRGGLSLSSALCNAGLAGTGCLEASGTAGAGVALSAPHCVDITVISYGFSLKGFTIFCSRAKQGTIMALALKKKSWGTKKIILTQDTCSKVQESNAINAMLNY